MALSVLPHPVQGVTIENESVPVGNTPDDPLTVSGDAFQMLCEELHQVVEQLRLTNALLMEIGK